MSWDLNDIVRDKKSRETIVDELEWLVGTVGTGPEAIATVKSLAKQYFPERTNDDSCSFVRDLMYDVWAPSCEPAWEEEEFGAIVEEAWAEFWEERKVKEEAARKQEARRAEMERRRRAAEKVAQEQAERERRKQDARLNSRIAQEFGITIRQVHNLRKDGTVSPERAVRLAQILGTKPEAHLRKSLRKTKNDHVLRMIMKLRVDDCEFARFVETRVDDLGENAQALMGKLRDSERQVLWREAPKSLEDLIDLVKLLGTKPTIETVSEVWKAYKIWRIQTITKLALYEVQEGL